MSLTPQQRSLRARIAANSRVASHSYDAREATRAAHTAYWARYHQEVDPTSSLPPGERDRKAKAAWQRDMARARLEKSRLRSGK